MDWSAATEFMKQDWSGVEAWQYFAAFFIILAAFTLRRVFSHFIVVQLRKLTSRTRTELDGMILDALEPPIGYMMVLIGLGMAVKLLPVPVEPFDFEGGVSMALKTAMIALVLWLAFRVIDVLGRYMESLTERTHTKLDDQMVPLVRKSLKVFVGILGGIFIIQAMGYSVSSLLAGLGIGGLAVALAAKDTIENLFGSITIFADRPFHVGDWIEFNGVEGTVEEVGFRNTRIRTFSKTLISVPNRIVAGAAINNFSRMPIRRVFCYIGVTYETTADQMQEALDAIRKLIREHPGVDQNFWIVRFENFGDSSLDIMLYYFTKSIVWDEFLSVREEINLEIMRLLEARGLSIAFPTRTVYMRQDATLTPPEPAAEQEPWEKEHQ